MKIALNVGNHNVARSCWFNVSLHYYRLAYKKYDVRGSEPAGWDGLFDRQVTLKVKRDHLCVIDMKYLGLDKDICRCLYVLSYG